MDYPFSTGQRYRVFLNEKVILISEIINITDKLQDNRIIRYSSDKEIEQEIKTFLSQEAGTQLTILAGDQAGQALEKIRTMFLFIMAGGGIVRNKQNQILFIKRFGKWDLPKGKLEVDETPLEGAMREVTEETGLKPVIISRRLPSTFHIYTDSEGDQVLKETYWYEMMYDGNTPPEVQKEEGITEARWFFPNHLEEVTKNTYASINQLLDDYMKGTAS